MIIFSPLSVFLDQYKLGFPRIDKIILNFVLTVCFYFPGLLYALTIDDCGSITGFDNNTQAHCDS